MKLTYSLILAAAACGMAYGAATAYTVPVGYVTLTIPANADTTIAPSLTQAPLLQAASTGIADNVITVDATGAATNAFINVSPDTNAKTYVLVRSGPLAGLRFPVTANDATTITVNGGASTLQAQGFASTNQISVIPYWTLGTLFPGGAGVGVSSAASGIFSADGGYVMFSEQSSVGTNRANPTWYIYYAGDGDYPAGWYDNNLIFNGLQDTVALDPAVMMTIRSVAPTNATVTVTGTVPSTSLSTRIITAAASNEEYLGCPFPVDTTLAQSGLQAVVGAAPDVFDPTDLVYVYPDETPNVVNKSNSVAYFYFGGDGDFVAGWYDSNAVFSGIVTAPVLKAGRCFTIYKVGGTPGSTVWTSPLPYSISN